MKTKQIKLTDQQIEEQRKSIDFYKTLIEDELACGDLCNVENIERYARSYKHHCRILEQGYVTF